MLPGRHPLPSRQLEAGYPRSLAARTNFTMSAKSSSRRSRPARPADIISVRGAQQNNLKDIDIDLPLGRLIVVTGPSGSGKSSFAFDTIYAEGQRRYVETFSPYTRQFLDRMDKPHVGEILGIPPAIALEQRNSVRTARSTVGTITEINDYLKLLLPHIARGFCPDCNREIRPETAASIVAHAMDALCRQSVLVTFRVETPPRANAAEFFAFLQQQGYLRVLTAGRVARTDEKPPANALTDLRVIQDRIVLDAVNAELRARFAEAIEAALRFGKGRLALIEFEDGKAGAAHPYSTGWHCAHCDRDIRPPGPALFSFNNPLGACPECRGFGRTLGLDLDKALPNRSLSIRDGVVKAFGGAQYRECQRDLLRAARRAEIAVDIPFNELPRRDREWVLYGEGGPDADSEELWKEGMWYGVKGFFDWLEKKTYKMHVRVFLSRYRSAAECPACKGGRYQPETLRYRVFDSANGDGRTLPELMGIPAERLLPLFASLKLPSGDSRAALLRDQITARLGYLVEVGLGYVTPDRTTRTLSGGEVQRVNLTSCLGAALVNTLFVLDEPTIGLHPRDTSRLVRTMETLRDRGNTLLVVEHEEAVIRTADYLVDIGPGRGEDGGHVVYAGPVEGALHTQGSLTADYLAGRKVVPVPETRRCPGAGWITVTGATANNLRDLDACFPIGLFTCVTGVSGSGKSTLVHDVLHRNLARLRGEPLDEPPGPCRSIAGHEALRAVVMVDQSPLSRTPRSTPALYTGVFEAIRDLFAAQDDAVAAGFKPGDFSFNSGNGRCDRCGGAGFEKVEMQFLSDVQVRCPDCDGKRFLPSLLKVRLDGFSIHDVLEMPVTRAMDFFHGKPRENAILGPLRLLDDAGLGYLRLGQPLNTLSGGESQRLKLVGHLAGRTQGEGRDLLIFDEPTTGLHFDDVARLLRVFHQLAHEGHTLIVIEHNIDVIKSADRVIDLGPEAGDQGGELIAEGTPEEVAEHPRSHTARWLRAALRGGEAKETESCPARFGGEYALRAAEETAAYRTVPSGDGRSRQITVHGAREHNLKNIDVVVPREKLVVVTGLSGSGKSTLAFDILFAEGQRRFLDSMSPYARQFVEQMEKPDVDLVAGLPPSVAIEQRVTQGGGKSTVATVTEVYHFLRLLFSKLGTQHCPQCAVPVRKQSLAAIVTQLELVAGKGRVRVLAPLVKARKGFHTDLAAWAQRQGFETMLVDGMLKPVHGFERLERFREHTIDVVVGEISSRTLARARDVAARALKIGKGTAKLLDSRNRLSVLSTEMACPECGTAFEELDPRLFSFNSPHGWCTHCHGFGEIWDWPEGGSGNDNSSILERELHEERARDWVGDDDARECPVCRGARLNETALAVRLRGETIADYVRCPVSVALAKVRKLTFKGRDAHIARDILPEIAQRLAFMGEVGLDYLCLDRSARTLSGGESQRIRLAAQLGSNLRGVLYVLDEPTIGLHPRDNRRLIDSLSRLRDKGNSLVIVEHDEETIQRADYVLDLGPGAGGEGGEVVSAGVPAVIRRDKNSVTGRWLRKPLCHPMRGTRRSLVDAPGWFEVCGAAANNLRGMDVGIPVGRLTVIVGISGAGKSSLMRGVIAPAVQHALKRGPKAQRSQPWTSVAGAGQFEGVLEVDQSPIGKTSRSTPATYIKVFDDIRALYAQLPVSRMRGYTASRFSFNTGSGRCQACEGHGTIKLEMNFLPPSYMPCEECGGRRFNKQTLEALYDGRSIGDVMDMTVAQAHAFFSAQPRIARILQLLCDTGLGYLRLGQPSPTLSGGEAQRIKLVSELARGAGRSERSVLRRGRPTKSMLYLLEEPTIGLHMADVERLLHVLHRLVDEGGTVIVIEHNPAVMAEADYIVEIGPEAGDAGGRIVASGPPETIVKSRTSRTAPFLRETLAPVADSRPRKAAAGAR